jgi:hypothetical protein
LESKIATGTLANQELADFKEQEELLNRTGYYPE